MTQAAPDVFDLQDSRQRPWIYGRWTDGPEEACSWAGLDEYGRKLSGVHGVTNDITIKPHLEASNIKTKIELALKRHAEVEANAIRVSVRNGNKVVLDGKVYDSNKRRAVGNAAWSAPGVAFVEDHLAIR